MTIHTPECHSKYITWGGQPRPCNCGGSAAFYIGICLIITLLIMLGVAITVTGGSLGHH